MCGGMRAETASAVKSIISNSSGNGNYGKDVQGWVQQSRLTLGSFLPKIDLIQHISGLNWTQITKSNHTRLLTLLQVVAEIDGGDVGAAGLERKPNVQGINNANASNSNASRTTSTSSNSNASTTSSSHKSPNKSPQKDSTNSTQKEKTNSESEPKEKEEDCKLKEQNTWSI